eukprot:8823115-Pyramimonas_sp.AAC.1
MIDSGWPSCTLAKRCAMDVGVNQKFGEILPLTCSTIGKCSIARSCKWCRSGLQSLMVKEAARQSDAKL